MMELLGHDGPPTQFYRENLLTGEPLARCPVRTEQLADPALRRAVDYHRLELYPVYRDHGVLPRAGALLDQDAQTLDYLRTIAGYDRRVERKYADLMRARSASAEGDA